MEAWYVILVPSSSSIAKFRGVRYRAVPPAKIRQFTSKEDAVKVATELANKHLQNKYVVCQGVDVITVVQPATLQSVDKFAADFVIPPETKEEEEESESEGERERLGF